MAYSAQDWEIVKAFYERGFSLAEIVARDEVLVKDRSSISRKAAKEGWIKGEKQHFVEKEIQTKQSVADIFQKKTTLNSTELLIHDTIVAEKTANLIYFNSSQLRLAAIGMQMVEDKLDEPVGEGGKGGLTTLELKQVSDVVKTSREGVLGKDPETSINISNTNAMQANLISTTLPDNPIEAARVYQDIIGK